VYAGRDGNVYRNQGGSWQKYENGGWGNVGSASPRSGTGTGAAGSGAGAAARDRAGSAAGASTYSGGGTVDQLNRDRGARSEGSQRTRDYGSYSSGRSSSSSYRSSGSSSRSGGGYRGGGGRGGGGRRR